MNSLDYYLLIPILSGVVFGLFKGLIKELSSLIAIVLGVYGAKIFAPVIAKILHEIFKFSDTFAFPLAYLLLFIGIAVVLHFLAKILGGIFDSLALGGVNKLLGAIFGGIKNALILSVFLNIFNAVDAQFSIIKPNTKAASILYKPIIAMAPTLWDEAKKRNTNKEKQNIDEKKVDTEAK